MTASTGGAQNNKRGTFQSMKAAYVRVSLGGLNLTSYLIFRTNLTSYLFFSNLT